LKKRDSFAEPEGHRLSATHTRPQRLKRSYRVSAVGMVEEARWPAAGHAVAIVLLGKQHESTPPRSLVEPMYSVSVSEVKLVAQASCL
jgi:hypothetical protein